MTKDELFRTLRDFRDDVGVMLVAKEVYGSKGLKDAHWENFRKAVRRVSEIIESVEGPKKRPTLPKKIYCDRCDGCGWYEGGPTLQTTCEVCKGSGVVKATA